MRIHPAMIRSAAAEAPPPARHRSSGWGVGLGVAATIGLAILLGLAATDRAPAETAAYRARLASAAATADEALAALRRTVDDATERARAGAAATVSGTQRPGAALEDAAERVEDARPAMEVAQRTLATLRGQLAIRGDPDAPGLLASSDDLLSIGAQLRESAGSADAFAAMRLATRDVLDGLRAALVGLRADDLGGVSAALDRARGRLEAVRDWPGRLATLPVWIETAGRLVTALEEIADARRDGDAAAEARGLDAYAAAADDATRADRALAIAVAEGGGGVSQAALARLADLLAKIDAARASLAPLVHPA